MPIFCTGMDQEMSKGVRLKPRAGFGREPDTIIDRSYVPTAPKPTTRTDCALTSVCRVAVVVNRRLV